MYKVRLEDKRIRAQVEIPEPHPLTGNPIRLKNTRVADEEALEYHIASSAVPDGTVSAALVYPCGGSQGREPAAVVPMETRPVEGQNYHAGVVNLPALSRLGDCSFFSSTVEVIAVISTPDGQYAVKANKVAVRNSWLFAFVAFAFMLAILLGARLLRGSRDNPPEWWFQRLLDFLCLGFSETAGGRYSVSLLQATFWTLITLWGLIFVWLIRWELLVITGQILVLLGIGGGTAIATRSIASGRTFSIPKYLTPNLDRDSVKVPHLSDLMLVVGKPSLFKFQILAATTIVGVIVVREIFASGSFPELDENLLLLMGISGGSYVLNEAAEQDSQKLRDLTTELEKMDDTARSQPAAVEKIAELEDLAMKLRGWERKTQHETWV